MDNFADNFIQPTFAGLRLLAGFWGMRILHPNFPWAFDPLGSDRKPVRIRRGTAAVSEKVSR